MRYPTPFQRRTLWHAATGTSILVLGALIVGLILLLGRVLGFLQPVLIPLAVAGIIAYVLEPIVRFLETRWMSRLWAVVTLFAGILLFATILVAMVLPGINQSQRALSKLIKPPLKSSPAATQPAISPTENTSDDTEQLAPALARSLEKLRKRHADGLIGWALTETDEQGNALPTVAKTNEESKLEDFAHTRGGRMVVENLDVIFKTGTSWLTAGSTKLLGFLGLVLGMIMVPVYLFFFLKDSASIRTHWHDYVPLKASHFKATLVDTLQEINGYLVSYFRGQVLVAAIDGILVGIALTFFGLPYGFMIGIFMALLGIIPYIGNIICMVPACVIAYLHAQGAHPFGLSPWAYVGCVLGIFLVVQQINSLVTAPKIVGDSVGLHPMTVIFSMLFWSLVLGGFVGALLAVPLTAAVKVLFRRFIWQRQLRDSPEMEPAA